MLLLQNKLMDEIFLVTTVIQKEFPELYVNLSETPLFLSYSEKEILLISKNTLRPSKCN
jgi:hypothetical protein